MNIRVFWVADHIAHSVSTHIHDFFQLLLCKEPGGTVTIENNTYLPVKDQVYLIKPNTSHSMKRGEDMKLVEIKFLVEEPLLSRLLELPDNFALTDGGFLRRILEEVAEEGLSGYMYSDDATNSAMKLFLAHIVRRFDKNSPLTDTIDLPSSSLDSSPTIESDDSDILILKLRGYIEENISREITLEELADTVFFNKTYFIKRFKLLWGMTPMRFVTKIRIERAKKLLHETSQTISEISELCGFGSIHYFSRTFKKETGYSPLEYRKTKTIDTNK